MAATAVLSAMNGEKGLHPFFTKVNGNHDTDETASEDEIRVASDKVQLDGARDKPTKSKEYGNSRRSGKSAQKVGKTQKTLMEVVNTESAIPQSQAKDGVEIFADSGSSDPIQGSSQRKKRRRVSQNESVEVGDEDETVTVSGQLQEDGSPNRQNSPHVIIPVPSPLPAEAPEPQPDQGAKKTPPKKMLKLNARGKFSSPISKHLKDDGTPTEVPKRRGRPRKSKGPETEMHLIVEMQYSIETDIGSRITRILSGEERFVKQVHLTPKKQRTPRKQYPSRPTHPFFQGKPKEPPPQPKQESPRKASAVTPGKLRRQTMSERLPSKEAVRPSQEYVVGSGLLKDRLMFKHPGAREPAWPSKESAHVRGQSGELESHHNLKTDQPFSKRKRKTANVPFPAEMSLLNHYNARLRPEEGGQLRTDGFREPHPSLTLPMKLLMSGEELGQRVAHELVAPIAQYKEENPITGESSQLVVHTALERLYNRAQKCPSAFDESRGETSSWTQKYEPSCASEVLQPSREMNVLKDWLTSITVSAVEGSAKTEPKVVSKMEPKPRKKRRRKHDDLDDFLVDSDEEVRDMDELTDPVDVPSLLSNGRKCGKSVVQVASEGVKLSNAVLLSGPHGCGKTAAAYAVAKELSFKVFEISACERRSGKDVLDKVGDMTENHLVKHHGMEFGETSATEEPSGLEEAFQHDLASGKQGKMDAFLKPQTKAKKASPKKTAKRKMSTLQAVEKAIKKAPKEQKQSLILLEEVDILFKDDKDFWNTVLKLISTSKRPFIMTCNDEDLVPLQAMSLHAILRFSSPPTDLATDYLLLLAAAEGHLLRRDAVASIYQSKGHDFRAAIAELDLWCQMGVGDPRGGLGWIFQRYPPGSDLDDHGRKLRVISDGTYQAGMGLPRASSLDEESRLLWARHEFGIDPETALGWDSQRTDAFSHLLSLRSYSSFANSLSAADVYCSPTSGAALDTTQPPMPEKARSQYIDGLQLLQADESINYSDLSAELYIASTLAAFKAHNVFESNSEDVLLNLQDTSQQNNPDLTLTRRDFVCFDAISAPVESGLSSGPALAQSAFDGPLSLIATDLAPYVRSIAQYDQALAEQRERLTSDGRSAAKRARTTRAARSALEGGQRASTRREKWFPGALDLDAVLATGGRSWPRTSLEWVDGGERDGTQTPMSSAGSA